MSPSEIALLDQRRTLALTWEGRDTVRLSASLLRRSSRGATAVRAAVDGHAAPDHADVALADVRLVGNYALQLVFSDGHDRGIYPFSYLRELAGH